LGKSIYENEMLAILHVVDLWCPYLLGQCFQIKTYHQSLEYIMEQCISSLLGLEVASGLLAEAEPNAHQFLCHGLIDG
jgi:hypothetical protein